MPKRLDVILQHGYNTVMKKWLIPLIIIIVLGVLSYIAMMPDSRPDTDQITAVIERGRQSIEQRSVSQAMSCVSENYTDSLGQTRDKLQGTLTGAFRDQGRYECAIEQPDITVQGTNATAMAKMTLSKIDDSGRTQLFSGRILITLTKEGTKRYLVFPTKEWKISKIDGIGQIPGLDL